MNQKSVEEAILMGKDAVEAWINTAKECDAKGTAINYLFA